MPQNTTLVSSTSQTVSPSTIFYQHSPDQHQQHHSSVKYPENGHDTLSDFVTFVCQEAENSPQSAQIHTNILRSPKSQYFPATMLPPPPLPPMARPVAIIRSTGDVTNSPPSSVTPPCAENSPPEEVLGSSELSPSPPVSPHGTRDRPKSPLHRISGTGSNGSPSGRGSVTNSGNGGPTSGSYSPNRDYATFNHFHATQPGHVGSTLDIIIVGALLAFSC